MLVEKKSLNLRIHGDQKRSSERIVNYFSSEDLQLYHQFFDILYIYIADGVAFISSDPEACWAVACKLVQVHHVHLLVKP